MAVVSRLQRFDVCLVTLDPTRGSEIQKTRPCLVLSPDEMNRHLRTIIVAPMTTATRSYPSRVAVQFKGTGGEIVIDQIRSIDKERVVRRLGRISDTTARKVCAVLEEMFRY